MENKEIAAYNTDSLTTTGYMPRSRVDRIIARAIRHKLVYVIAGAGYGKTLAVRGYFEGQDIEVIRWIRFTESDNSLSNFWEHLVHEISSDNPELADGLRELGFPETLPRFKRFFAITREDEYRARRSFIVLDDFHLVTDQRILAFVQRYIHLSDPGVRVIIISRTEPKINAAALFAKGKASVITEEDLRFTEDEIAGFLRLGNIPYQKNALALIARATKGWALALVLLCLSLRRNPDKLELALDTMRENIFKLMETEAFIDLSESDQKTLVQFALLSDLPLASLHIYSGVTSLIQHAPALASFLWFDSLIGDYRIHPLYLEFLRGKTDILSQDEQQAAYRRAASSSFENGHLMDAMRYFAKTSQYARMLEVLLSYPFKLPYDTCEYFLNIIESLTPDDDAPDHHSYLLLKNFFAPILLTGMGRYEDARELSLDAIREWESSDKSFAPGILFLCYSNLAYIDMYICTITHRYESPEYLRKSVEYLKLSGLSLEHVPGPFAVADIRSFVCLVGAGARLEDFDLFLEASRQTASYVSQTISDMYYGYDDLVACEIDYYKNLFTSAKIHARQAIVKAREKKQYSLEAVAQYYLLLISVHDCDFHLVKELIRQLRGHLNNHSFWNRHQIYDLSMGAFYSMISLPAMTPSWLLMNDKDERAETRIPARELLVIVSNCLAQKKYDRALVILNSSYPRDPHERFALGETHFSLFSAVAKMHTGDSAGAIADFIDAYSLSFDGVFETPFIERGRDLRALAAAVAGHKGHDIPAEWLKTIVRKASAFAKKAAVIKESYMRDRDIEAPVLLSKRELEVLEDLYHGLAREEIAANRYLSIHTVKKVIESIYVKLDATNIADAIRIGIKTNLVGA